MTDLDKFRNEIRRGLLPGEDRLDLEKAAELVANERATFLKKKEPEEQDFILALCSLCIPIPFCPPKTPSYTQQARSLRKESLRGLAGDPNLQNRFKAAITSALREADPATIKFEKLTDFIRFDFYPVIPPSNKAGQAGGEGGASGAAGSGC